MGNSDNVIGYIEYLSDDGKIVGYGNVQGMR